MGFNFWKFDFGCNALKLSIKVCNLNIIANDMALFGFAIFKTLTEPKID